jgi:hypothetical protein
MTQAAAGRKKGTFQSRYWAFRTDFFAIAIETARDESP